MPSLASIFMRVQIRMAKPILKRLDIEADRVSQDKIGELGAKALSSRVSFEPEPFTGFEADWAVPKDERPDGAILYLHGGGYTAGSLSYARGFGGVMADNTGMRSLCAAYRLAPEHKFPCALDDALSAYLRVLERGYDPKKVAVVGESAGGGLSFCLGLRLKERGLPLPACFVGISPWADLTMSGASYAQNAKKDPSLFAQSLKQYAAMYAESSLENPLVSPVFGDFTGFPPSLVFAGTYELLLDDSRALAKRIEECAASCELHEVEGMWHVFVLFGTPEAKEAIKRIAEFIAQNTGGKV